MLLEQRLNVPVSYSGIPTNLSSATFRRTSLRKTGGSASYLVSAPQPAPFRSACSQAYAGTQRCSASARHR